MYKEKKTPKRNEEFPYDGRYDFATEKFVPFTKEEFEQIKKVMAKIIDNVLKGEL